MLFSRPRTPATPWCHTVTLPANQGFFHELWSPQQVTGEASDQRQAGRTQEAGLLASVFFPPEISLTSRRAKTHISRM